MATAAHTAGSEKSACADLSGPIPRVRELYDEAVAKRSPYAELALRRIWQEWDQGDPSAVEDALAAAREDARLAPSTRVYAGVLHAFARRRRGDLDGAQAEVRALGYVGKWLTVGPFDNEGKAGFSRAFGPELDRAEPIALGKAYDGKERAVRWRGVPESAAYGWSEVGSWVRPSEKTCAYVTTFVRDARPAPAKARAISIWVGAAGAVKVMWNGEIALTDDKYRDLDVDRAAAAVTLKPGWNRLLVKVCGDEDAASVALRLGAADGGPNAEVEVSSDPSHSSEAAAQRFKRETDKPTATVEGPLARFERLEKSGDPAVLEAFARFLLATDADDPAEHKARELARRAAEKAPTVDRLLLAGDLSEDRNQRAVFIDRAEELVKRGAATPRERTRALLARASHTRGSANWRDAVPFYDRILAADPDDVVAVLARTELYTEAGLRETALAFLLRALERRPRSVALLRASAAALADLGRTTEAEEIRERYAALRFDDPSYLRDRIDVALAKRDPKAADHWVGRLLAVGPENVTYYATASRAYAALGDRPRAIAALKRALDVAPEDTGVLRALANLYSVGGQTSEQLALLRKVLELQPQAKDVREYVAHTEPAKPRPDEAYAMSKEAFLKLKDAPSSGQNRRTLVDLQVTTVYPNGLASRFHQVVFQPLTDAGAQGAREYAFSYEANTETVQLRGAKVYRKNGQVDEALETGETAADNPSLVMYTSARVYYVHFPRLYPGDVVELQYRVEDVAYRNAFADYFGEVNVMQSQEPVAHAEYVLITPKSRTLHFNKPNVPGLTQTAEDKGDQRIYRFVADNVPAVEPEPLQPPASEILGHVHVSTYKSWDDMGAWYWGLVKDQFVADDEVKRRAAEITKGLTDDRAKVRAVYDYVVQKTRYVALEFGIHGFKPYRCAQIFARGFGDCKDKATLIVTMLKHLGIQATIVIVRTGMRGDFETEPASLAPFDHAIAYVPAFDLYLDGTAEYTGSNELPTMDRGSIALQINEGKPKLVRLPDPPASESVTARRIEVSLGEGGAAQMDWRADVTGAFASTWRQRYHAEATRRQRVQEDVAGDFPGFELAQTDANDLENVEIPVRLHAKGKVPQLARRDGETWSVPAGPREHMVQSYATLSNRRRDLKLSAQTTNDTEWVVKAPAGAKVTSAPKAASGSSAFGSYKVEVETLGGAVRVKTSITLAKTRVKAQEYPAFRAFCEEVDRALGQRIVYTVAK